MIENKIKITNLVLEYLNYDKSDSYGLLNANVTNLIPVMKLLKGKENNIYNILHLSHKIIDGLSKGERESQLSYSMLFKDSKNNNDSKEKTTIEELTADIYLHDVIKEKYTQYGELKKRLEAIH